MLQLHAAAPRLGWTLLQHKRRLLEAVVMPFHCPTGTWNPEPLARVIRCRHGDVQQEPLALPSVVRAQQWRPRWTSLGSICGKKQQTICWELSCLFGICVWTRLYSSHYGRKHRTETFMFGMVGVA